jgi:4-amino-4-deoxy-L-arabinose transferase-like glycosyltransferase
LADRNADGSWANKIYGFFSERSCKFFLFAILILAFAVRIYYFYLTRNQALWWDEAEYMSIAKHWLYGLHYAVNPQRPPLFPILEYSLLAIGFGELAVKFILSVLPSMGIVYATYLLGKEFYDERVGLVAAFITSSFWVLVFNSMRIHTDQLGMLFGMLAIYFFWRGYAKKEKQLWLAGLFLGLSFLTRLAAFLYVLLIAAYLVSEPANSIRNWKRSLVMILPGVGVFAAYLLWMKVYFGDALLFLKTNVPAITGVQQAPAWNLFRYFFEFNGWIFFALFLLGLLLLLFNLLIALDLLVKEKNQKLKGELFVFFWLLLFTFYFVFVLKSPLTEHRYMMPMAPAIFILVGAGLMKTFDLISKHFNLIAIIFCAVLLALGTHSELKHADIAIKAKIGSYQQVKEAALWMRAHSSPEDYFITWSEPQTLYYSERNQLSGFKNESDFEAKVLQYKPKYLTISVFERHADWIYNYPQRHAASLVPVQAYFFDEERKQPALIVYEFRF